MLSSIGTCILEAVLQLWFSSFLLHPLGASTVGLSSWPWHYWKCTFTRSTAKSSTSVLFAQWPSNQQTAPWLTWPASTQQSLTRLLSKYFVIICSSPLLHSSTAASTFCLSCLFFFLSFFLLLFVSVLISEELPLCWQRSVPNHGMLSLIQLLPPRLGGEEFGQGRVEHLQTDLNCHRLVELGWHLLIVPESG